MDKNWIQQHIVKELSIHSSRRYSELKPVDVEGNLFMYHLDQLIKDGYVEKVDKKYQFTHPKGQIYSTTINVDTGAPRPLPKIVLMFYVQNKAGNLLMFKWQRQPYIGKVSLPYGRTDFGVPIYESAASELFKKTSLVGKIEYKKDYYVLVKDNNEVINHMLANLFVLKNFEGELKSNVPTGTPFWCKPSDIAKQNLAAGVVEILEDLKKPKTSGLTEIITDYS